MNGLVDLSEIVKRIIKYLVLGLVIAIVAIVIPKKSLNVEEIMVLALTAAATFAVVDTFLPSISDSLKSGIGFSLGSGLAGGLHIAGM
jgi:ABC-type Co2+ transport system permease subunit